MSGVISKEDFYKLEGLLALAKTHNRELATIQRAAAEITQQPDDGYGYFGHTTDAIWQEEDAGQLLNKLEIEVVDV